LLMTLSDP